MNKFLLMTYAVIAILASGFAKAETSTSSQAGVIAGELDATFDNQAFEILVSGISPNDCSDRVILAEQQDQDIYFKVINTVPLDSICTQRISKFVKSFPVRAMISISRLQIEPNLEYTLSVVGSPLTVKVLGSELLAY